MSKSITSSFPKLLLLLSFAVAFSGTAPDPGSAQERTTTVGEDSLDSFNFDLDNVGDCQVLQIPRGGDAIALTSDNIASIGRFRGPDFEVVCDATVVASGTISVAPLTSDLRRSEYNLFPSERETLSIFQHNQYHIYIRSGKFPRLERGLFIVCESNSRAEYIAEVITSIKERFFQIQCPFLSDKISLELNYIIHADDVPRCTFKATLDDLAIYVIFSKDELFCLEQHANHFSKMSIMMLKIIDLI
ncbi:hypothetical protein [Bauldia sp.]|uniref:hypothetical protein n=1 Tax=Bauldia sp. TaxID=2575872 RepID=UPI003BA9AED2